MGSQMSPLPQTGNLQLVETDEPEVRFPKGKRLSEEEVEKEKYQELSLFDKIMRDRRVLLCKGVAGICFRAADTGLDVRTAVHFFRDGHVKWASLCLTFIFVCPVVQCAFIYVKRQQCALALPFLVPFSIQHIRRELQQLLLVWALPQWALYCNIHVLAGATYLNAALAGIEVGFESLPQALIQLRGCQVLGDADLLNYISLLFSFLGVAAGLFFGFQAILQRSEDKYKRLASANGDTLGLSGIPLSSKAVRVLASSSGASGFITKCDMSYTACSDDDLHQIATHVPLQDVQLYECGLITDTGLMKVAENCPGLKQVTAGKCKLITDQSLMKLAENCPGLIEVDFSWCDLLTDQGFKTLAENCAGLNEVWISGCKLITDEGLMKLAENGPGLKQVALASCNLITDKGLMKLAENCPGLTQLVLRGCRLITDKALIKLSENCPGLTQLWLNGCSSITDKGLMKLAENCPQLKKVGLNQCSLITDECRAKLADDYPQVKLYF